MTSTTASLPANKAGRKTRMKSTGRSAMDGGSLAKYVILVAVSLVMLFPIYWIVASSLKTLSGISSSPPIFFPTDPQWQNYLAIFQKPNVMTYLRNSAILVFANTAFTLISSSLVAYPLARMRFLGRGAIFALILATMMVPSVTVVLPQFLLFREFGWLDSLLPMIIPSLFAAPYNVFLFRQFFMTIPVSVDEAARLDGCTRFGVFFRIIVPLAKPIFITVGVLSAISWWNELFLPVIYINSDALKPLALGATTAFIRVGGMGIHEWHEQMAFAMLMAVPPMITYAIASRYISGGIKTTGSK
ncbi:MAG: carbohydrate ABC transporter permease [Bifidobacteriaceae bacterium]|nr:carbohydrate ABC transporter permease [Bifidobacteriaceae bacterium]